MITLYLTRHGETKENIAQVLQGHLPGNLTEKGKEQAYRLRNELADIHFDAIISSDLKRTLDTATILNEPHSLPIISCSLLRERDWGELAGIKIEKIKGKTFPDSVETIEEMTNRAHRFIQYLKENFEGNIILIVGHGVFNRCIQSVLHHKTIQDFPRMGNAETRIEYIKETTKSAIIETDIEASAN